MPFHLPRIARSPAVAVLRYVIKPFGLSHIILGNQGNEDFLTTETFWQRVTRVFRVVHCFANDSKRTSRHR